MNIHNITGWAGLTRQHAAVAGGHAGAVLGDIGCACWTGLCTSNLHFCLYAALAGIMFLQAWYAWRDHKGQHAREHGLAGLVHTIMAILTLHLCCRRSRRAITSRSAYGRAIRQANE